MSRRVRRCCDQDAIVIAPRRLALGPLRPLRGSRFALGQPDAFGAGESRATTEAGMRVSRLAPTRKNRSPRIFEQARSASPCSFGPSGLTRTPDTKSRLRDTRKNTERDAAAVGPLLGNGLWRCIIIDKQAKLAVKVILRRKIPAGPECRQYEQYRNDCNRMAFFLLFALLFGGAWRRSQPGGDSRITE